MTRQIREEFARQARTLESAVVFNEDAVLERIRSACDPQDAHRLLDLACGPGIVAAALAPDVDEVVAFDLTPEMLERTRARTSRAGLTNVRPVSGSGDALPFEAATFDRVVSRLAIHHFPDVARVLEEVARVTRPGGRLVLADVLSSEDEDESLIHNTLETMRDPSHVRMLPRTELLSALDDASFELLEETAWSRERRFGEWIAIVNAPERAEGLEDIMASLGRAGIHAGIELEANGGGVSFVHHWILLVAVRK